MILTPLAVELIQIILVGRGSVHVNTMAVAKVVIGTVLDTREALRELAPSATNEVMLSTCVVSPACTHTLAPAAISAPRALVRAQSDSTTRGRRTLR